MYICVLLNHTVTPLLYWRVPLKPSNVITLYISLLIHFQWFKPFYYLNDDAGPPADTREKRGGRVVIAEHVGHAMIYKIFTGNNHKVICRSNICFAMEPAALNLRLDLPDGDRALITLPFPENKLVSADPDQDTLGMLIKSAVDFREDKTMMAIAPEDMVGKSFQAILRTDPLTTVKIL